MPDRVIGSLHAEGTFFRVMRVAGDEVNEPTFDGVCGDFPRCGAKTAGEAAGRDLKEATRGDDVFHHFGRADDAAVPLGVGEDADEPLSAESCQQWLERDVGVVREFEQHVSAPIRQSHHLALLDQLGKFRLDADVGPGNHGDIDTVALDGHPQTRYALANRLGGDMTVAAQLMRCGNQAVRPVGFGHPGHGDRLGEVGRAIVDPGHDVAVDIDELWHCAGLSARASDQKPCLVPTSKPLNEVEAAPATRYPPATMPPPRNSLGISGRSRLRFLRILRHHAADACRLIADRCTGRTRPLPAFVIAGAMRAGTTSLFEYLAGHPQLAPSLRKEVHYFDLHFHRGPGWYARQFGTARQLAHGELSRPFESSPYYMFDPRVPARLRELVPDARIVFLLRDPVERAISHYRKNLRDGREPLSFADAIDAEDERLAGEEERMLGDPRYLSSVHQYFSYRSRGEYAPLIERYRRVFSDSQLLLINAGRLFGDPGSVLDDVCRFLGLEAWRPATFVPNNVSLAPAFIDAATRRRLEIAFEPHEQALEASLGWRPSSWRATARAA